MKEIVEYFNEWEVFQANCLRRSKKAGCHLSSKNWEKLREWHFNDYLSKMKDPWMFLLIIKSKYPSMYKSMGCVARSFHYYQDLVVRSDVYYDLDLIGIYRKNINGIIYGGNE